MRVVVLSSGSRGNTTFIESGNIKILIDAGNTCKYIVNSLKGIGIDANELNGIFITHTHVDHVKGLKVFLNKFNVKVFCSVKMLEELDYVNNYMLIDEGIVDLGDLIINVIRTSHDVSESFGYILEGNNKSVVYVTDTGYINNKYFPVLSNRDLYIMESNHDIEMLNNGRYSFNLRQRILGDKGHLSNYDSAMYLSKFIGDNTKCIMLAHLSEENNSPSVAYDTLMERLSNTKHSIDRVIILEQDVCSEEIYV